MKPRLQQKRQQPVQLSMNQPVKCQKVINCLRHSTPSIWEAMIWLPMSARRLPRQTSADPAPAAALPEAAAAKPRVQYLQKQARLKGQITGAPID